MTEKEERAYQAGRRAAFRRMLQTALGELGYDSPEAAQSDWIIEREQAIAQLRELCATHGDNDWPDDLNLADVIEKHLADYLYQERTGA